MYYIDSESKNTVRNRNKVKHSKSERGFRFATISGTEKFDEKMRSSPRLCVVNNIFGYTKRVVVFCALRVSDPMSALPRRTRIIYGDTSTRGKNRFAYTSIRIHISCRGDIDIDIDIAVRVLPRANLLFSATVRDRAVRPSFFSAEETRADLTSVIFY